MSRVLGWIVNLFVDQIAIASSRVGTHYGVEGKKVKTLFAPVDVDLFEPRDPTGFPGAQPNIGLLANWNWIKGQDRYVEVISRLRDRGWQARGKVVGEFVKRQNAFWEPVLNTILRLGLDEIIDRPGFVADVRPELAKIIPNQTDLTIHQRNQR